MKALDIIFLGPSRAGKSTAIDTLGQLAPALDIVNSEHIQPNHPWRHQGIVLHELGEGELQPGLAQTAAAFIILASNAGPDPLMALQHQLQSIKAWAKTTPIVVGISQMDINPEPGATAYGRELHKYQVFEGLEQHIPLLVVDPRDAQDMALLLETALYRRQERPLRELA